MVARRKAGVETRRVALQSLSTASWILLGRRPRAYQDDIAAGRFGAICRPCFGELASLLEQVTAPIGGFHLIADCMRQRHFADLAREIRPLGAPVREGGAEAMRGQVTAPHAP